jgi:predicted permease
VIQVLANSLVPIFVGLLFGYAAGLFKIVDNKDVKSLVSFLMTFALPSSLFVVIAVTPRPLLWEQAKAAVVLAIVFLVVFVATYYASRKLGKETAANSAVLALTLGFPRSCLSIRQGSEPEYQRRPAVDRPRSKSGLSRRFGHARVPVRCRQRRVSV